MSIWHILNCNKCWSVELYRSDCDCQIREGLPLLVETSGGDQQTQCVILSEYVWNHLLYIHFSLDMLASILSLSLCACNFSSFNSSLSCSSLANFSVSAFSASSFHPLKLIYLARVELYLFQLLTAPSFLILWTNIGILICLLFSLKSSFSRSNANLLRSSSTSYPVASAS